MLLIPSKAVMQRREELMADVVAIAYFALRSSSSGLESVIYPTQMRGIAKNRVRPRVLPGQRQPQGADAAA